MYIVNYEQCLKRKLFLKNDLQFITKIIFLKFLNYHAKLRRNNW